MATVEEVYEAFGSSASGRLSLWRHVAVRLAWLTADQVVVYGDTAIKTTRDGLASGAAVLFTESHVVLAEFTDTPIATQTEANADEGAATVTITAWSRQRLLDLRLEPERDRWNTDLVWENSRRDVWPSNARLTLMFADRSEPLRLPLSDGGQSSARLGAMIPDLLDDLATLQSTAGKKRRGWSSR